MSFEAALLEDLASFQNDPYRFVMWAFPWQEPGELETEGGPELWQAELLCRVRDGLAPECAIQECVASGHDVGKSALVSWLILWALSTFEDTRGVVTANTETQLKTKTWAELGKWHRLFIAKEFFELTATCLKAVDPAHELTWRIDMIPWSERNTEAFAGLHNRGRRVLAVFDEGSAIPDVIYEVTEGAMTDADTQLLWFVFGNPTRNTGRFKALFPGGQFTHRWHSTQVDSRQVRFTNKAKIDKWLKDYGVDSDFVRVRVLGVFPRAGTMQFIPSDLIEEASHREAEINLFDPLVLGVDVARFGDDDSVIYPRKGRDAKSIKPIRLRPLNSSQPWLMILASKIAEVAQSLRADAIFVDEGGMGAGVVDRLRQLGVQCIGVNFGGEADRTLPEADEQALYHDKSAEMWGFAREFLKTGSVPDDPDLKAQAIGREYGFDAKNRIQLEKKADMKKRGLASPDIFDALALTFAYPVFPRLSPSLPGVRSTPLIQIEYDPYDLARSQ
jgi:hypothetical protein